MTERKQVVRYEVFRGTFVSWDTIFAQAAEFASSIGPERLIGISHSQNGVVAVWYWSSEVMRPG